ncbi:MAG TPA: hypothetical protein V6C81_02690 [Planktothrix sp.]
MGSFSEATIMQPKHVLQQAVSTHHSHIILIGILVVLAVCAVLATIGFVLEQRALKREQNPARSRHSRSTGH